MSVRSFAFASTGALALVTAAFAAPVLKPKLGAWGVDFSGMDKSVKPGDDFGAYVNGNWLKRTEIAPDRTSAGAFLTLRDQSERDVRDIAEKAAATPGSDPAVRQIGDLYASWMDTATVEAKGNGALKPYLGRIAAVQSKADLEKLFTAPGYAAPVDIGIGTDPLDPEHYAVGVTQGRLALTRDYYLNQGAKFDAIRAAYKAYVVQIGTLMGWADAAAKADRIMALETAMAGEQWSPAQRRDVKKSINPMSVEELQKLAPNMDWALMLDAQGLPGTKRVMVRETTAITALAKRVDTTPLDVWKDYLAYRFVSDHARYLPKAFDDANFAFFGKTLSEQPEQRVRWQRGVEFINGALGESVGKIYVADHFPAEAQRQMAELIEDLRGAYGELIDKAAWMDPATKAEAKAKLAAFDPRIGHPVSYIDYSPYVVKRDDLLGNAVRAEEFRWTLSLKRYPKPVDRTLWSMTPQTVNAYYSPPMNQITFPAAILQPPFFDPAADPAVNYGGIGAVIGHEMGHGFDDQGRQFDAKGKLRDWWSPETGKSYMGRAEALAGQYDAYEPIPGTHINGHLTLGENLGDLGGIQAAYTAYQRYQARHGKAGPRDGLSGDQRFFVAYAQIWQQKTREGALRQNLLSDPHSPGAYRVNGIVRNADAWYKAFDVKPGDKLYLAPEQRLHVW